MTGGWGFVGRHLIPQLKGWGHEVHAPTRENMNVLDSLAIEKHVSEFMPDTIIHLAAVTSRPETKADELRIQEVNVVGASNVARCSGDSHIILASTCHVYGVPSCLPISEGHPLQGLGLYARSKILAEEAVLELAHNRTTILRLFNLLGPSQSREFALAGWCWSSCEGEMQAPLDSALQLLVGDLSLERDYLDVRDAVDGIGRVVEGGIELANQAINVCSGEARRLEELFSLCAPGAVPVMVDDRLIGNDVKKIVGCNEALRSLGWRQRRSLESSISDMRSWIGAHLS